jgi:hypothetical protein
MLSVQAIKAAVWDILFQLFFYADSDIFSL